MNFTKASIVGLATGFAAGVAISMIRVPRPGFLINAEKQERLSKKEAAALLNDAYEDLEMLFDLFLAPEKDPVGWLQSVRMKAMVDPRWAELLVMYERNKNRN